MKIISRSEAKAQGLKRYFTGAPCTHGHVSIRFTSNYQCTVCTHKMSAERQRKRYAANPQKARALRNQRYNKNRAHELAYERARKKKISRLIAVLRQNMPDLLKEFGL